MTEKEEQDIRHEDTKEDDMQQFDLLKSIGYGVKNMKWGDTTSNYRGYAVSQSTGVVHVDPATNKLHRDDHICNQQCRDLAARAKAEYERDIRQESGSEAENATDGHLADD